MAYNRITWAADVLRDAGLNVVEEPGWKTRGLSTSQRFEPDSIVWHHDASAIGDSPGVPDYMIRNMATHGAQIWVCAGCNGRHVSGTWHLVASGRMAHAGKVLPGKPDNYTSIGIETDQTVGETWEPGLLPSLRKGTAALLRHMKKLATALHFHKTICDPPGRKVDPVGLNLLDERARVKTEIAKLSTPPPPPVTTHTRWAIRTTGVHDAPGGKKLRDIPEGYKFQVVDGSGHGNDGWIQTSAGNWVVSADTTTRDPALPSRLSVSTHNVWNARDWEDDVLPTINAILPKYQIDVPNFQECYRAPDLRGKVPGYTFRNQGYDYEPETPGYIEERSDNVILVRDGVEVKVHGADQMTESWAGPKMGVMHDPRVFRRVTVNKDEQNFRVINVHGPFGTAARQEFLTWAREEFEELAALGDPVIFIGDWNVSFETLKVSMGPLATVDGGPPDMVAYANCRKADSANLGRQGSDTHNFKIWVFEA